MPRLDTNSYMHIYSGHTYILQKYACVIIFHALSEFILMAKLLKTSPLYSKIQDISPFTLSSNILASHSKV